MKTKNKGQALTEFALILPILLLLILGIIEGGRIIWAYITVQNAAREAARYAITGRPYDVTGNPWNDADFPADRQTGCDPQFNAGGELIYSPDLLGPPGADCAIPNDRVDAIIGVALESGRGLGVDQYAIHPAVYTASTYYDQGGTYGVRVLGQDPEGGTHVDYASTEGLDVRVQVYYNVTMLDPLYAAIIPNGYVRLFGEVEMQNEGIDALLGGQPPPGIEPPDAPVGDPPPPGGVNPPTVLSLDGNSVDAGSDLRVKLEYHTPNERYDIYLYSSSLGYVALCLNRQTDAFGSIAVAVCNVPPDTTPGPYQLVTVAAGDPLPATHVAEGDFVDVLFPGEPLLTIADSSRWPPGSTITFQMFAHLPCPEGKDPCPPYQTYDIALIGGVAGPSPGTLIAQQVPVDVTGTGSLVWSIPEWLETGTYTVVTYAYPTVFDSEAVATTVLEIVPAEIVVQGGNRWPAGTSINVFLRGHAPGRTYTLRWIDGITGATTDFGPVTTDQFGNTIAPLRFPIPSSTSDSPPNHRIISFETPGSGVEVASTEVEVFTPAGAFIVVVGGNEWPAGSLIQIELHKHFNGPYELYFDDNLIEPSISPNASGFYATTYIIPILTAEGSYEIRTEKSDGSTEATITIDVTRVPLIQFAEGSIVQPGSVVTVQLINHAPNDVFEIYLEGNKLFDIQTDANGRENGLYTYDLNNLSFLQGGPFVLESQKDGSTIASAEVYIVAPDLQVTNIEFPPGPPVNVEIPVTVTVFNDSPVALFGEYFDVDLYLNPAHAPTTSSQFPPGDYKRWVSSVPATGTVQVVFNLTLDSTDYAVYGRVDTSNYIPEMIETNNIYDTSIQAACAIEVADEFDSAASQANWTGVPYGDADSPPSSFTVSGGTMNLVSDGSSNWGSSDNLYYVHHNQFVIGNFEARVRLTEGPGDDAGEQNWAKAGLEIRSNAGSDSSPKVDLAVANSGDVGYTPGVQAGYRDGGGGSTRPTDGPGDGSSDAAVSYPVWLRIVRDGDRFTYYYSDSDSATPPVESAWIPHGSVAMSNMSNMVAVGLFNASYHSSATDTASFDNFHICVQDDTTCGAVDQTGGRVVLEAINFTANIPRSSHQWQQHVFGGFVGMQSTPDSGTTQNTGYAANSPELQYQANFDTTGTYYVWVYGRGPNGGSNSVHVGLDGAEIATSDRMDFASDNSIDWSNGTMDGARATLDVPTAGSHTINVWMREDGFAVYKILLTDDPSYTPSGNVSQSPCAGTQPGGGDDDFPPGLTVCTGDLIQNGGFEGTQLAPWSIYSAANKNDSEYQGLFGLLMYSYITGEHTQSAVGQSFDMPDWIISTTTTIDLSLYQCTRDFPGSGAEAADHLNVGLRSTGLTPTLVSNAVLVADGNTTNSGPCSPGDYAHYTTDLAAAIIGAGGNPENYAEQTLELYLHDTSNDLVNTCPLGTPGGTSGCYETNFRVDNVELEVCTTQPIPPHESGKATIGGPLRVFLSGAPQPKQGVRVWTYRQNGDLLTTYSLHDSNYFFYNLDPGTYVIYSEYWDGPNLYSAFTTVTVGPDETINDLSLLLR